MAKETNINPLNINIMNIYSEENPTNGAPTTSNGTQSAATQQKKSSKFTQTKLGLKILIIVAMGLLMLIPQHMILRLIRERNYNSTDAEKEVGRMWSREQTVVGPVILIPGMTDKIPDVYLLPEELTVNGDVQTQKLHKGIFDVAVFTSDLDMQGSFLWSKLEESGIHPDQYDFAGARMLIGLGDLRGLTDNVVFTMGGKEHKMASGQDKELGAVLVCPISLVEMMTHDSVDYHVELGLKGSRNLHFHAGRRCHERASDLQLHDAQLPGQLPARHARGHRPGLRGHLEGAVAQQQSARRDDRMETKSVARQRVRAR